MGELGFANLCFSIASSFGLADVCVFDGCDRFCGCVAFGDSGVVGSSGACGVNHSVATSVVVNSGGCYFVASCGATTLVVCFCCSKCRVGVVGV